MMWKRIGKNGNKYWGKKGAGIFFTNGKKVLLLKRAEKGDNKDTWCLPGGKVEEGETFIDAARRESREECGKLEGNRFEDLEEIDGNHIWKTFFFEINKPFDCELSDEHSDWNWFDIDQINKINLHPKLKENIDRHIKIVEKHFKKLNFKEWLESSIPLGQCFPYALKFSLDMLDDGIIKEKDIFICHGTVVEPMSGSEKRYEHAWVEAKIFNEERVYDWQMSLAKNSLKKEDFYELFNPTNIKKYSIKEAVKNCALAKHHGPWD